MENLSGYSNGIKYEWVGGLGAVVQSWERGCKLGDVRMIEHEMFHVYMIESGWWKSRVSWTWNGADAEMIRELKAKFFGVERKSK